LPREKAAAFKAKFEELGGEVIIEEVKKPEESKGIDAYAFLKGVFSSAADLRKQMPDWKWDISYDGKFVDMGTSVKGLERIIGTFDVDKVVPERYTLYTKRESVKGSGAAGKGIENLIVKLSGKKVISLNVSGEWVLEVVE
jgi:hypothetical protein